MSIDYNQIALEYTQHRKINPLVLEALISEGRLTCQSRVLEVGCGTANYLSAVEALTNCHAHGCDPSEEMLAQARTRSNTLQLQLGSAEKIDHPSNTFDLVFSIDVIHHLENHRDYYLEAWRVLKPGGRLVLYVPNRWYPFETHGVYWRGRYHYGNIPLVNYLPDVARRRLAPHVRAYTRRGLRRLFEGLPVQIVVHRQVFAGYDNIVARWPRVGRALRTVSYALERTPLQVLGLSHLLVFEKATTTI